MTPRPFDPSHAVALLLVLLATLGAHPVSTGAQLIPIRTVPVASGDQFRLLPSSTAGMGGVTYAVDDSIGDAWLNPALGARVGSSVFMGSPTFYGISNDQGGGRSFPIAGIFTSSAWFGGISLALQQIENSEGNDGWFLSRPTLDLWCCPNPPSRLSERFGRNLYAGGFLGRRLDDRWSAGIGVAAASIGAMDGVDLLYAGSDRIEQSGGIQSLRVGALYEGARDRMSFAVVHDRVSMQHDVHYTEWIWNDTLMTSIVRRRVERNEDQTRTWAGQVAWDRELDAPGWRVGATGTINYKSHPKIPNYSLQNIPRDPGTTWAYEAGFGFSRSEAESTFAVDVAVQPIWSNTWQEANAADVAASGGRLSVGDRSIENDFFFTNVMLRGGLSHEVGIVELQTGIEVRSYDYQMKQVDRVVRTYREQDESWIEWSPTFGAIFGFSSLDLHYSLKVTTGTGRPGTAWDGWGPETVLAAQGSDYIIAPEGPLTLQDVDVVTHQIAVTIPVR